MTFSVNNELNYDDFTTTELLEVIEILVFHDVHNFYCISSSIFEVFRRIFQSTKDLNQSFYIEKVNLRRIKNFIRYLLIHGRFSKEIFRMLLLKLISNQEISLEVIWWLDKNNLFYFAEYCCLHPTSTIVNQLKLFIPTNKNLVTNCIQTVMARYLYNKLFICAFTLDSNKWLKTCYSIYNELIKEALIELCDTNDFRTIRFIKLFLKRTFLYGDIMKKIFTDIIQRLTTFKELVEMNDVWYLQQLCTSNKLNKTTVKFYTILLSVFNIKELNDMIQMNPIKKKNWNIILNLIAVYSKSNEGYNAVTKFVHNQLEKIFESRYESSVNTHSFFCVLLFIRQACLEKLDPITEYSKWYSSTFGSNSNLKTSTRKHLFSILLNMLSTQVIREPLFVLQVHVEKTLRAPPGMQSDMRFYKDSCRIQINKITNSPFIKVESIQIPAIIILEECLNNFNIPWALKRADIREKLLPIIVENSQYTNIKNLLIHGEYVTASDLENIKSCNEANSSELFV